MVSVNSAWSWEAQACLGHITNIYQHPQLKIHTVFKKESKEINTWKPSSLGPEQYSLALKDEGRDSSGKGTQNSDFGRTFLCTSENCHRASTPNISTLNNVTCPDHLFSAANFV